MERENDGLAGVSRRNILKSTALATGALGLGLPLTSGYARAAPVVTETIYLVDTGFTVGCYRPLYRRLRQHAR